MVFRIRYRHQSDGRENEVEIEATSPTEALVKFRHLRDERPDVQRPHERVTSICLEKPVEEAQW